MHKIGIGSVTISDFLKLMTSADPSLRPSPEEIVKSKVFSFMLHEAYLNGNKR